VDLGRCHRFTRARGRIGAADVNERQIAESLANTDYYPNVGQCTRITLIGSGTDTAAFELSRWRGGRCCMGLLRVLLAV
jgi:hypothetical protein